MSQSISQPYESGKEDSPIELYYTNEEGVKNVEAKRQRKSSLRTTMISTIPFQRFLLAHQLL